MCFSAQIVESWRKFLRVSGIRIDFEEFMRMFELKATHGTTPIVRAVERWFDAPTTMEERRLQVLIGRARAAESAVLEREMAEFLARQEKATARLAAKVTKTAANELRIATQGVERMRRKLAGLNDLTARPSDGRFFPKQFAPIIVHDAQLGPVVRLARYLLRRPQDTAATDTERPGCFNVRRDSLSQYWRGQFGTSHALLPASAFFENVKGKELKFSPEDGSDMLIACLYSRWKDPTGGPDLLTFGLVTDEPPPEVAAAGHDRCPVNLSAAAIERWLTPQGRSVSALQALLDERHRPLYAHEVLAA